MTITANLGKAGRLVIPAAIRNEMQISEGSRLVLRLDADGLHILSPRLALEQIQAAVRKFVPPGVSLVDELIADRRREAECE